MTFDKITHGHSSFHRDLSMWYTLSLWWGHTQVARALLSRWPACLLPSAHPGKGILKGEVSLYHWPPIWLVWKQLYGNWQFLFLFAKQTNPNQWNRKSTVQWYLPLKYILAHLSPSYGWWNYYSWYSRNSGLGFLEEKNLFNVGLDFFKFSQLVTI
jgi:hypothetical protein